MNRRTHTRRDTRGVRLPVVSAPDTWADARRVGYLLIAPFALAGCAAGILLQLPDVNPLDLSLLPLIGLTVLVTSLLVGLRRLRVEAAMGAVYVVAATYFVSMLGHQYDVNVGREQRLSEAVFWFPALYALAFLAWELPAATLAAGLTLLGKIVVTGVYVHVFQERGEWTPRLSAIVLQFLLSNGVLLMLLVSFAHLRQRLAQMKTLVYVDFLTSLPNRRYGEDRARQLTASPNSGLAVAILDIDHFKSVNDRFGHHIGDHVLREVALVASGHVRSGALLARWGGEEFVLLLPGLGEEAAARDVERIRQALEHHVFEEVGRVTASFGVAARLPGETFHDLLERADTALYAAKRAGRNQVVRASNPAEAPRSPTLSGLASD